MQIVNLWGGTWLSDFLDEPRAAQKLAQMAQLPIGPWAVDIYDEDHGVGRVGHSCSLEMCGSHQSEKITSIHDNNDKPIITHHCILLYCMKVRVCQGIMMHDVFSLRDDVQVIKSYDRSSACQHASARLNKH